MRKIGLTRYVGTRAVAAMTTKITLATQARAKTIVSLRLRIVAAGRASSDKAIGAVVMPQDQANAVPAAHITLSSPGQNERDRAVRHGKLRFFAARAAPVWPVRRLIGATGA